MTARAHSRSTSDMELAAKAETQIRLAVRRLGAWYIFHARIIEQFVLRNLRGVPTMGVSVFGEKVMLAYNPRFVLGLPLDQLIGVLVHEINHVLFKHILLDPNDFANTAALTVAEELVVNEFVGEPLPQGAITLAMFPRFPRMESTMERYRRLEKIVPSAPARPLTLPFGSKSKRNASDGSVPTVVDDHSVWEPGGRNRGQDAAEDQGSDPSQPQDAGRDQRQAEAMVDNLLQSTANQVGADALPDYVKRQLGGRWAGSIAGNGSEELQQKPGTLDWVRLLRRYVGQAFEVRADYRRPARRFVDRVGIVPGKRRASLRPRVMAVLDTSGSMTPESLATISGELSRMAACYRVTVVECDCAIQKVYEFRPITQVSGRGGTSFLPPLETSFLRTHKPDLIVFFTDGFGDAPDRQPRAHVIWCLVPGGQRPAPWGRVISMNT